MSVKKRFLEHLEAKGAIPKGYMCGGKVKGYASGGMVRHDDDEWEDDGWNDHDDDSGEPFTMSENYMVPGYAFGGKIMAHEHEEEEQGLHGHQYGKPNFAGPKEHEQVDQDMSEDEIRKHMVKAIRSRRGRY